MSERCVSRGRPCCRCGSDEWKAHKRGERQRYDCRPCALARGADWRKKYPLRAMLEQAKARAKEKSIPFDICEHDLALPDCCPVLGIPLSAGRGGLHSGSPTLDRLDPAKGYTRGNVAVISHRANRIKNDATLSELKQVVSWVESHG